MRALPAVALVALLAAPALPAQAGSPAGAVPVERLVARREALAARMGTGLAVLRSAEPRDIERGDYPQDADFREKNDFFYLTGLEAPGAWLLVQADSGRLARTMLLLPPRNPSVERWTGPRLGPGEEATARTGIAETRSADSARTIVRGAVAALRRRPGASLFVELVRGAVHDSLLVPLVFAAERDEALPPVRHLGAELAALRLVKDADELARLRKAIEITATSIREAWRAVKPGAWEYEVEAAIEAGFRRRGAERLGFPSIVGSGPNSTVLHYDVNRRQLQAGDLVVTDVGAEFGYQTADVTRTVPVSGRFTPRQRALYELVLATQQAAIDAVRPGVTMGELNRVAREHMRAHSGTLCGEQPCDRYFVHGLGHWLGMDVHDVGDYATPLAPGMVLTVEPGVYIPEEGLGIRIEDDVLVTAAGAELLSGSAPRAPAEIERAMRAR